MYAFELSILRMVDWLWRWNGCGGGGTSNDQRKPSEVAKVISSRTGLYIYLTIMMLRLLTLSLSWPTPNESENLHNFTSTYWRRDPMLGSLMVFMPFLDDRLLGVMVPMVICAIALDYAIFFLLDRPIISRVHVLMRPWPRYSINDPGGRNLFKRTLKVHTLTFSDLPSVGKTAQKTVVWAQRADRVLVVALRIMVLLIVIYNCFGFLFTLVDCLVRADESFATWFTSLTFILLDMTLFNYTASNLIRQSTLMLAFAAVLSTAYRSELRRLDTLLARGQHRFGVLEYLFGHFARTHTAIERALRHQNDQVVSMCMSAALGCNVPFNIWAVATLGARVQDQTITPGELILFLVTILFQVGFIVGASITLTRISTALYSSTGRVFRAQLALGTNGPYNLINNQLINTAYLSPWTSVSPLFRPHRHSPVKWKVMAQVEHLSNDCPTCRFAYTIGSLGAISDRSIAKFLIIYSSYLMFVYGLVKKS